MLVPSEFARAAVVHGTVATVSDPHEIGNVLGVAGVRVHARERGAGAVQVLLRCAVLRAGDHLRNRRRRDHGRRSRSSCSTIRGFATSAR